MQETTFRAAIYARTATNQENGASFATDAQIHACMEYAQEKGYQIIEGQVYKEIASGATAKRPALMAVLAAAEKNEFDLLIIYDYSRLARHPVLLENLLTQFEEAGITVETAREKEPLEAAAQLAIYARKALRERTKRRSINPPHGYALDTQTATAHINPIEAEEVTQVFTEANQQ